MATVEQVNALATILNEQEKTFLMGFWEKVLKREKPEAKHLIRYANLPYPERVSIIIRKFSGLGVLIPMRKGSYLRAEDHAMSLLGIALVDFLLRLEGGTNET